MANGMETDMVAFPVHVRVFCIMLYSLDTSRHGNYLGDRRLRSITKAMYNPRDCAEQAALKKVDLCTPDRILTSMPRILKKYCRILIPRKIDN